METHVVVPDYEVILRVAGSDVAVIAFFRTSDEDADALVGVALPGDVEAYAEFFEHAAVAVLHAKGWEPVDSVVDDDMPF